MVFFCQLAQFSQADPDWGVRHHILIFPVDRIADLRRRQIQQGDHMKRFRMYEHTEDRRRNDRPVIMPVIVLERPGKDMLYCSQSTPDWIIFQYSLLYRTVFQAIDGMNKKTAAFLLLRQSQKEGIYIVNVFKTKGRGAVALANIFCWAAALLYAQMASKSVMFSMPFFINAVHSQASLSACLISGCFVFNYQNLCPF